jgi:hypothetical protein
MKEFHSIVDVKSLASHETPFLGYVVLPRRVHVGLLRRLSNGGVSSSSNGIPKLERTLQLQAKVTAEV